MKTCTTCKQTKPLEDFNKDKKAKDGFRHRCKKCHAEWMRAYNKRNAEIIKLKQKERDAMRPRGSRHGITQEQYDTLFNRYDGKCWSCKEREAKVIDHDHKCCNSAYSCGSCVRGMLCQQCNTAFGLLKDSVQYINALAKYAEMFN